MENVSKSCQVKTIPKYWRIHPFKNKEIGKVWYNIWKGMVFHFYPRTFSWEEASIKKRRGVDGEGGWVGGEIN